MNKQLPLAAILLFCTDTLWAQSPTITTQPQSQAVRVGSNVVFQVIATGGEGELPLVNSGVLKLWLRSDLGVVTASGKVTQWNDQSGNVNHAAQNDANRQPLFATNAVPVSGRPVVRFDGVQSPATGDFLQGTGNVEISDAFTSFLVYSMKEAGNVERMPVFVGQPGAPGAGRSYYVLNGEMALATWSRDYFSGFIIPTNTFRIWTDRVNSGRTSVEFFDSTVSSNTNIIRSISQPSSGPAPGYFLGGFDPNLTTGRNFSGDIAELIYYQGSLTDSDRLAVENFLKQKYFQVATPGTGPLVYQWRRDGAPIANATNSSLVLTNLSFSNAGNYSVAVSNNFGGTISSNATLAVLDPVVIVSHPEGKNVVEGTNVTFSVSVTGGTPLSFQWKFNGVDILSATDSSFVLNSVQSTNSGNYSAFVSNPASFALSSNAFLSITTLPNFLNQPQGAIVLAGTNVTLTVSVQGNAGTLPQVPSGNLQLWLKADAGVSIDSSNRVSQWQDQSSNTNHCFQPITVKQPLWIARGINNRPALRFDGVQDNAVGDFLQGSGAVQIPDGFTSFLVYTHADRNVIEEMPVLIGVPGNFGNVRSHFMRANPVNEMTFSAWGSDFGSGFSIPPSIPRTWTERVNATKTQVEFFDTDGINNFSIAVAVNGLLTIGSGYFIGGLGPNTRHFQGDIAEVIYYQGALSNTDRPAVEDYLKQKYFQTGSGALAYLWQLNGTNVLGATNASLSLTNSQPAQSGNYTVVVTNSAGSITSAPAVVTVRYIFPQGNGQRLTNSQSSFLDSANISFETFFTNGMVFYTLDGSPPSFASEPYNGSFVLNGTAVLRAIAYSADFSQSGESDPVNITIIPTYILSAATAGGGSVVINGSNPFLGNTMASVTANPSNGWTFLQWLGDASGTNPTTPVNMTRNKSVQAIFGTTLNTTVAGNGSISVHPVSALYPYGTVTHLTATPQLGNYFGIWGNAASGNTNPLDFAVITPNPTISSLFSVLSAGQFSLAISANGSGQATVSPRANKYSGGQSVTVTATPDSEQIFTGWSGDASGTNNPLNVTMNQSKAITANFTKMPRLTIGYSPATVVFEGFQLTLTGAIGESYLLEKSTNLMNWSTLTALTNFYGTTQVSDLPSTNASEQFYRTVQP